MSLPRIIDGMEYDRVTVLQLREALIVMRDTAAANLATMAMAKILSRAIVVTELYAEELP